MRKPDPEFTFDDRGLPTLAVEWDQKTVPQLKKYPPTASGRRARGQLENLVDYVVKEQIVNRPDQVPTNEYIAKRVAELDGVECSTGAVWKVLQNWERIGYAQLAIKPRRFHGFTEDGIKKGLPELYRQERRKRRQPQRSRF